MSAIYLIRHAQAGTRDNYDLLSDLGREQVTRLAAYFKRESIEPAAVISGRPRRQRETAEALGGAVTIDAAWDEFNLGGLYRSMSPRLASDHEGFSADYEQMRRDLVADPHTTRGAVGRCDQTVIRSWMENRYPDIDCQTWQEFKSGVVDGLERLRQFGSGDRIVVFTSATPIAVAAGHALGVSDQAVLALMSVIYNTGITTIRLGAARADHPMLFTFNSVPHLDDRSIRSFR